MKTLQHFEQRPFVSKVKMAFSLHTFYNTLPFSKSWAYKYGMDISSFLYLSTFYISADNLDVTKEPSLGIDCQLNQTHFKSVYLRNTSFL